MDAMDRLQCDLRWRHPISYSHGDHTARQRRSSLRRSHRKCIWFLSLSRAISHYIRPHAMSKNVLLTRSIALGTHLDPSPLAVSLVGVLCFSCNTHSHRFSFTPRWYSITYSHLQRCPERWSAMYWRSPRRPSVQHPALSSGLHLE